MHPDDAVLRSTGATLRRIVTIFRPDTATFACFDADVSPVRRDHACIPAMARWMSLSSVLPTRPCISMV